MPTITQAPASLPQIFITTPEGRSSEHPLSPAVPISVTNADPAIQLSGAPSSACSPQTGQRATLPPQDPVQCMKVVDFWVEHQLDYIAKEGGHGAWLALKNYSAIPSVPLPDKYAYLADKIGLTSREGELTPTVRESMRRILGTKY